MIKKILLLSLVSIFLISGCSASANLKGDSLVTPDTTVKTNTYQTADNSMEFTFNENWDSEEEETPFDLQLTDSVMAMSTGVFVYNKSDITKLTPLGVFNYTVDDLISKRDNPEILEEEIVRAAGDKSLTSTLYTAEKDGVKYNYYFSLIEFGNDTDKLAVVVQTLYNSDWEDARAELDAIVESAKIIQ